MTLEDSTTYQWIREQVEEKHARKMVSRLGTKRFGPPDATAAARLAAVADASRLDRMAERVLDAAGWDELLTTE